MNIKCEYRYTKIKKYFLNYLLYFVIENTIQLNSFTLYNLLLYYTSIIYFNNCLTLLIQQERASVIQTALLHLYISIVITSYNNT